MSVARLALPLIGVLCAAVAHAACLVANREGQEIEGRLDRVRITEEAYVRTETAFILTLARPACLEGMDEYDTVESTTRVHVYSTDAKILRQLQKGVGKTVRVTGTPFGEDSPHHHAPIVMDVSELVLRK